MVFVKFTNGFGNNIFQYVAAKQLAHFHNKEVYALCEPDYYAIPDLKSLGIKFFEPSSNEVTQNCIQVGDSNYLSYFSEQYSENNLCVSGYFEDYRYYKSNIQNIKKWFPHEDKKHANDLVVHVRLGDRLLYAETFDYRVECNSFLNAIGKFSFENLHVVTDMPIWRAASEEEISKMRFHVNVDKSRQISISSATKYFNSLVESFEKFSPIVENRNIVEDFNHIRSFGNILFQHGTMAWWAAVLSDADNVGVYGPWRPWKGASNKNLSDINLKGWFKWE